MRRLFFLIVSISLAVPAISQSKHPLTFEDMMKLKRVGEPEVSLDGKWVIFSVVDVDVDANTKTPHIWIVPAKLVIHGQRDYKIDEASSAIPFLDTTQIHVKAALRHLLS
jgi:dipeptidyl aminopeptidase/acylaminoacyl peptidase